MTPTANTILINVFRDGGVWFGARWIDGQYDGCDRLNVGNDASDDEAIEAVRTMPLLVEGPRVVRRVDDYGARTNG